MCKQVTTTYHVPPSGSLINLIFKASTRVKVKYYIRGTIQNKLDENQWNIEYEDITYITVDNEYRHIQLIIYALENKNNPVQRFIDLYLFTGYRT